MTNRKDVSDRESNRYKRQEDVSAPPIQVGEVRGRQAKARLYTLLLIEIHKLYNDYHPRIPREYIDGGNDMLDQVRAIILKKLEELQ